MKIHKIVLCLLAASLLALGGTSAAFANAPTYEPFVPGKLISVDTVAMEPVCDDLAEGVVAYILNNNLQLCGYNTDMAQRGVANGNCGDSAIFLYDGSFAGQAQINWGFSSAAGVIVLRSFVVEWDGATTDGSFIDFSAMSSAGYSNSMVQTTGSGLAYASFNGTVVTNWGLVCVVGSPSDSKVIA
jgi:hypothetical protein